MHTFRPHTNIFNTTGEIKHDYRLVTNITGTHKRCFRCGEFQKKVQSKHADRDRGNGKLHTVQNNREEQISNGI